MVDVGDFALHDPELIDLEGRDRLHGLLPAPFPHRHLVPSLMDELREVEVEDRPLNPDIGHHTRA